MQAAYKAFNASLNKLARHVPAQSNFEKFHHLSLDFRVPIAASIGYVLVVSFFSRLNRERAAAQAAASAKRSSARSKAAEAEESRFTPFKCLVITHNVLLCAYSALTFLSVLPLLLKPYFSNPVFEAFCDLDKSTFMSGVNFWVWNFYMSKYYELLDTAILLWKGKPSSFLQTFHHSGSIIGMWIMTTTHAPAGWIFVLFNSFIHTVMYFYYTLTCFGFRPAWKKFLTSMQITQFLVGNPLGLVYAFLPGCFPHEIIPPENIVGKFLGSQARSLYACLIVNTVFIGSLIVLFTDFSRKTYGKPKDTEPVKVEKAKKEKVKKAIKESKEAKEEKKTDKPKKSKSEKAEKADKIEKFEVEVVAPSKTKAKAKTSSKSKSEKASRSRSRLAKVKRSSNQ